eukprot:TRINITY_DN13300_c0_g1_i1.p1 TRINITY_DN13300_c0_g1~~TRINITY_DN13300_c0_g1_i1.p1  ORF type:complete len:201 (+),score=49.05 TRINITY_DN13300_c0_g1_i1:147-749(+)
MDAIDPDCDDLLGAALLAPDPSTTAPTQQPTAAAAESTAPTATALVSQSPGLRVDSRENSSMLGMPNFRDFQMHLVNIGVDIEQIGRQIPLSDEALRLEIDEVSDMLDEEIYERKDSFDRLRLDLSTFAHRKTEKIVMELEEFAKEQQVKECEREHELLTLAREMDRVKMNFCGVGITWSRIASQIADPGGLQSQATKKS